MPRVYPWGETSVTTDTFAPEATCCRYLEPLDCSSLGGPLLLPGPVRRPDPPEVLAVVAFFLWLLTCKPRKIPGPDWVADAAIAVLREEGFV
jgi:hypothetical protein